MNFQHITPLVNKLKVHVIKTCVMLMYCRQGGGCHLPDAWLAQRPLGTRQMKTKHQRLQNSSSMVCF